MNGTGSLFGTDGIRAPFGSPPLVEPTVRRLGRELAGQLSAANPLPTHRPEPLLVVVGGDTRDSSPILARWLADGLAAGGVEVAYAGVIPTPAIALLTRQRGAAAGVVLSASHNLPPDNGIKLVGNDGFKWPVERETELEARLTAAAVAAAEPGPCATPAAALAEVDSLLVEAYGKFLRTLPAGANPRPLAGLRIALDCANGAASAYAPELFAALGAEPLTIHDRPDGANINRGCGSTHPSAVADHVRATGADFGVAFDGDADRALLVDERGELIDGDALLYLWASALRESGELGDPRVVATSMSNLGLEVALARHGVAVVRCDVGDRAVVETMRAEGLRLGGEQSGHIVDLTLATTGDGLLTAREIARIVAARQRPLSELVAGYSRFPQLLRNVRVARKPDLDSLPAVRQAAADISTRLGSEGRLVLRYSGTEPLCRIMLEGPDLATIEVMASELEVTILESLG